MGRRNDPLYRFQCQRASAKKRSAEAVAKGLPPIEWKLTFEQWWDIWEKSGKWKQRGCRRGQYVMARHDDAGHYEVGNVSIVEAGKNGSDGLKDWGVKKKAREDSPALGKTNASIAVEGPRTPSSSFGCIRDKEVANSEAYIENAARIYLENEQRYGRPQSSSSNRIVDISSHKSSKQSNAAIANGKSSRNLDDGREIGLSLIEKMGEAINLLKRLFEGNYSSKEAPRSRGRGV